MDPEVARFVAERAPFLEYLKTWEASWPEVSWEALVAGSGGAERVAVVGVDLVNGFCHQGALASPQVNALVGPTVRILTRAHQQGVHRFLFPCDAHPPDSPEFEAWPSHCVAGTPEAELVGELRKLPFASAFQEVPKTSVNSFVGTDLAERLLAPPELSTLVVLGDVTDLCLYQAAMNAGFLATSRGLRWKIVVPASAVATSDLPVEVARLVGARPHDGQLLHLLFLYHLELNGVQVVKDLL